MMPKSSAMYLPWFAASMATKMLPGCMSAWKKPSRNTCVKKISTPARARRFRSMPARAAVDCGRSGCPSSAPSPSLRCVHQSQCISGHQQQRRVLEVAAQLRAVRRLARQVELVVERLVELGDDLARPQALAVATTAARPAARRCASARGPSRSPRRCSGRSTLTATGVPSGSSAKCTCATDALATGVGSNVLNTSSSGLAVDARRASRSTCVGRKRRHAILQLARARRRCRAAAGRAASTASART